MVRAATPPGQSGRNGLPSARLASDSRESASANTEISGAERLALAKTGSARSNSTVAADESPYSEKVTNRHMVEEYQRQ